MSTQRFTSEFKEEAVKQVIDARLTLAALSVAIEEGKPPLGCVHHSDRGSQYAAKAYRDYLADHGIKGSMGRRGNPYDNAKAESFMKTLKVEGVYPIAFEIFGEIGAPGSVDSPDFRAWTSMRTAGFSIQFLGISAFTQNPGTG